MTVVEAILHFGRTRPGAAALVEGERTITYGQLAGLVRRTASHLLALGLGRADRIGLCLADTTDHMVALLAVSHIGAVAMPLDWRAPPAEGRRLVAGLGLTCVLTGSDARGVEGFPQIFLDEVWHGKVALAPPMESAVGAWHEPFVISATSGSTGAPKLTQMTHQEYYFAVVAMWELMGLSGRHRFLCTMPFFYSGGRNSCIAHLLRGDCVVLYPSLFTAAEYVDIVERQAITTAATVPSTVRQLLAASDRGPLLPGLTAFYCTGAPLHRDEKWEAVRRLCPNFHERYGTAETLVISILHPGDLAQKADSVGQPHSLARIEIVDDGDRPLPAGAQGRLRFRAPGLGSPLPGSAAEASFREGWFYPGEIGHQDEAGYIFLRGRSSDVIIRSGAKIFPAEVEAVLAEHSNVLEAAVLGQRSVDNEETVIAFVVAKGGAHPGELLAHCRSRLTPHKVPRRFHFVDNLPRNRSGKVDKAALAQRFPDEKDNDH